MKTERVKKKYYPCNKFRKNDDFHCFGEALWSC